MTVTGLRCHADTAGGPLQDEALYKWDFNGDPPEPGVVARALDARRVVDDDRVCTNLGYYLFPNYWGKSFATGAVQAAADHLLRHGMHRLVATVTVGNRASARSKSPGAWTGIWFRSKVFLDCWK